ncbi:MAG: Holliday junction resolvase RuvX [Dehalococcoidales bacterium]|nr:Holliday junction resolvase RuvX [Dehalococcoidales bacterium]
MKRILSLDIGDRRIGVAMSDTLGILATPLTILDRKKDELDVASIIDLVNKHDAGQILAGLPRSLSGGIGQQAEKVLEFVEKLKQQTNVPIELRDERFTTLDAQRLMREAGTKNKRSNIKNKKEKMHDDAAAAAVLLQGYLDEKALERQ